MKNLKRLGVLLTAVGAICLLAGTQPVKATEKATIAEGVYIGNVNVGGMTQAQAQSAVEEYVAGLMDTAQDKLKNNPNATTSNVRKKVKCKVFFIK